MTQINFPIGVDVDRVDDTAQFALGQKAYGEKGEYIYLYNQNNAITGAGYVCNYDGTDFSEVTMATTANSGVGQPLVVPLAAVAAGKYTWYQTSGVANVRLGANCAAGARLNTTATAGVLDDDGTAGAHIVDAAHNTTLVGGSAANSVVDLSQGFRAGVVI